MAQITSERQNKEEEDPVYRRAQKEHIRKLEQRVKERNTEQPAKPKQLEQGQNLSFSLWTFSKHFQMFSKSSLKTMKNVNIVPCYQNVILKMFL